MGLLINSQGLKKSDGTDLPSQGVFVKFIYQSEFESLNQKYFLRYYTSQPLKTEGYSAIDILVPQFDDEENIIGYSNLPNQFVKELTIQDIMQLEQFLTNLLPNASCFEKTLFSYHLFIKQYLEGILGDGTVDIRVDLT